MNKRLLQAVTFGGLFHDIGKFAERAGFIQPSDKGMVCQEYRYAHALNTENALRTLFTPVQIEARLDHEQPNEATLLNLAARHHSGRFHLEWMIQEADCLASGHERAHADQEGTQEVGGRERKNKVRLLSILGRIQLNPGEQVGHEDKYYRLVTPDSECGMLFPQSDSHYSATQMADDYPAHWHGFVKEIKMVKSDIDPLDYLDTYFAVCKRYLWCVPASTRKEELPDVSLYEHAKGTAALAACLCAFHGAGIFPTKQEITNRNKMKYLLFCGDVSGIQKFIYRISSKGAYKNLKGRSFFVQLISELLARRFVDAFDLTSANILYCNGGKFYLLLPNLSDAEVRLREIDAFINHELFCKFKGDLYVRTAWTQMSGIDLLRQSGRTLSEIWDELTRKLIQKDRSRFLWIEEDNYNEAFGIPSEIATHSCSVCHQGVKSKDSSCQACMEMERLGQELKTARYILVSNKKFMHTIPPQLKMFGYNVWVCQNTPAEIGAEGLVWVLDSSNDLACLTRSGTGSVIVNAMSLTMGSNRRFDCDFEEIAQRSKGVPRLGMLRMDVDNLGAIFYRGLKHYRHMKGEPKRFYSLARITTLSSQLAAFFCDILPRDIERNTDWNKRVTVVYAGGDDLFLLGAWDALPEIALFIQERFKDYCCRNPAFSLSGGMVVTHGRFPIYKSAEMAGTAEQVAKAHQTKFDDRTIQEKNAFTLFDTPMHWREFSTVHDMVKSLKDFMQQPSGRPLLNRLRAIAASWHSSKWQLLRNSNCVKMDDIRKQLDAEKWRWQSVYAMCRIVEGHQNLKSIISDLQAFICNPVSHTNRSGIELLGMLCQWLELLYRNVQVRKGE